MCLLILAVITDNMFDIGSFIAEGVNPLVRIRDELVGCAERSVGRGDDIPVKHGDAGIALSDQPVGAER